MFFLKTGTSYWITKKSTENLKNEKYGDVKLNNEVDTKVSLCMSNVSSVSL